MKALAALLVLEEPSAWAKPVPLSVPVLIAPVLVAEAVLEADAVAFPFLGSVAPHTKVFLHWLAQSLLAAPQSATQLAWFVVHS